MKMSKNFRRWLWSLPEITLVISVVNLSLFAFDTQSLVLAWRMICVQCALAYVISAVYIGFRNYRWPCGS